MRDARRGARQTAYQVLVAGTPEKLAAQQGDLWDSGRVESDQSTQIVYAGRPLRSRMRCYWNVRLWDADGRPTPPSEPALWTMGLLGPEDIRAKWIGCDGPMTYPAAQPGQRPPLEFNGCDWYWAPGRQDGQAKDAPPPKRFFRAVIATPKDNDIRRTQFLTAAGDDYEVFVNGKPATRFGHNVNHAPHVTDLVNLLAPGKNVVIVAVADGPASPAGLAGKLVVEYENGQRTVQPIDGSWKVLPGTGQARREMGQGRFRRFAAPRRGADRQDGRPAVGPAGRAGRQRPAPGLPAVAQGLPSQGPDPPRHALRQRAGPLSPLSQRKARRQRLFHARLDGLSETGLLPNL